jgi:hypothetical protein
MGFDDAPPPAYSPDVGVPVEHNTRSMSRQEREAFIKSTDLPPGLGEAVLRSCDEFALRIWVIDNSGSMGTNDGTRFSTGAGGRPQLVKCTRWQELGDALSFVAKMAAYLAAPTEFRLLNPPAQGQQVLQCGVGEPTAELRAMESMITSAPSARTPLCAQIRAVVERVRAEAPRLRASGKRCIVVIASDGASTDGDVEVALRPLQELPVWVVVRLCTDQEDVVDYWSRIDRDLELEMDVLDDLKGEAQEIAKKNPFVTYGSHLHRLREWGTAAKVLGTSTPLPALCSWLYPCRLALALTRALALALSWRRERENKGERECAGVRAHVCVRVSLPRLLSPCSIVAHVGSLQTC